MSSDAGPAASVNVATICPSADRVGFLCVFEDIVAVRAKKQPASGRCRLRAMGSDPGVLGVGGSEFAGKLNGTDTHEFLLDSRVLSEIQYYQSSCHMPKMY
jgi:hypothetical protein